MVGLRAVVHQRCLGSCLTWPYRAVVASGIVEGHVSRIKMIKRQMYGRAGFSLLRKRVLRACLRLCYATSVSAQLIANGTGSRLSFLRHESTARVTQAVTASRSPAIA